MKVVMLKQTVYAGPRRVGDIVDVTGDVAQRWLSRGIAEPFVDATAETPVVEVDPYDGKKAKELYEMCKAAGIEVKERQSRDYYIGALEDKVDADTSRDDDAETDGDLKTE